MNLDYFFLHASHTVTWLFQLFLLSAFLSVAYVVLDLSFYLDYHILIMLSRV